MADGVYDDVRVASHERQKPGARRTDERHLPEQRGDYRHRARSYWETRADALGADVGAYIREVFDSDDVLDQLRTVQAIVTHLADHPPERAQAACRRASFYVTPLRTTPSPPSALMPQRLSDASLDAATVRSYRVA